MKNKVKEYNAFYCCCIVNPWLEVARKLDKECNIRPVYYIGWGLSTKNTIQKIYNDCFYQSIEDAWKGENFPLENYSFSFDEELIKSISFEKNIAIKMMDRLDLDRHSFSFSDREAFFYYLLKKWLVIIDTYNIDIVISPSIPHRVFDYVLYIASKIKKIEFIMFQMTPFTDSSFIINDIECTLPYLKDNISNDKKKLNLRDDIFDRITQVKGSYENAVPDYMQKQTIALSYNQIFNTFSIQFLKFLKSPWKLLQEHSSYHVQKGYMPFNSKNIKYKILYQQYKNKLYLRGLLDFYKNICSDIDIKRKYVFVALHYQPEETTCPTGGAFVDQYLIIELLNDFLESDYEIIVKEHKTQFHPHYEGAVGRNKVFYKNVLNISPRIKFANLEEDPFKLIDNAVATVTVSGTIGWESVIRGTPTLIFGRAWYEDMIGVFKIKSKINLQDKWSRILTLKNNIMIDDILDYHTDLQKYLIESPHYKAFVGKVHRNDTINVDNIYRGIYKYLKNVDFYHKT